MPEGVPGLAALLRDRYSLEESLEIATIIQKSGFAIDIYRSGWIDAMRSVTEEFKQDNEADVLMSPQRTLAALNIVLERGRDAVPELAWPG